ncbi:MAG: chemotaxis protein CheV [Pseudomonadales bacterium]|nr:chemotaxis protein CheV [Pseudomonadales bacterium]
MVGVLEAVDQRTQLVGQNRLELLLFRLDGDQVYGINVFKVKEVLRCPKLTLIPKRNPVVRGVAHIRGGTISVLDLNHATGHQPLDDIDNCFVIIAEYNRAVQGFLVRSVERIVNINWASVHPPPKGAGKDNYLTAVTDVEDRIVEIIDVEKILSEVAPRETYSLGEEIIHQSVIEVIEEHKLKVLVADDSSVARKQIKRCVEKMGIIPVLLNDGLQALEHLQALVKDGVDVSKEYIMMISDIEMPEMDGYTLTAAVRADPKLSGLHVILHTSLSGIFNQAMVEKVGANNFLAKFKPEELADLLSERVNNYCKEHSITLEPID